MKLIGMLDSPYVRRAAIGLRLLRIEFEHTPISVFGEFDAFRAINPVVKAPTLLLDDGEILMDSTLILDYARAIAAPDAPPGPRDAAEHALAAKLAGLALAACEKTVQIVYERRLRPPEKQHEPWVERVRGQLHAAYGALEASLPWTRFAAHDNRLAQTGATVAIAWRFTQMALPEIVDEAAHPRLTAFSASAEDTPLFAAFPPD
ncbi:glutathione S-transferase [Burkholderia mayonis]|uniref:Glutathione S-transferase n=1 Tax=Burkholderia mayonis TaxID=1385591 RepID=A0A1B4FZW7_9BURK|nr:glutathione S-transferase [Burkholderia mayonis]AOJ09203.1 glutathione S-transferase [Burkholderia mayonis]KVE50019.1 glutathione S-transferase [Burkholderia mayonis]